MPYIKPKLIAFARARSSLFSLLLTGTPNMRLATALCRSSPRSNASRKASSPLRSARMRSSQVP
jgi:hypothetical protein